MRAVACVLPSGSNTFSLVTHTRACACVYARVRACNRTPVFSVELLDRSRRACTLARPPLPLLPPILSRIRVGGILGEIYRGPEAAVDSGYAVFKARDRSTNHRLPSIDVVVRRVKNFVLVSNTFGEKFFAATC